MTTGLQRAYQSAGVRRAFVAATCGLCGLGFVGMAAEEWSINKPMAISIAVDSLAPFVMGALMTSLPKSAFNDEPSAKAAALKPSGP